MNQDFLPLSIYLPENHGIHIMDDFGVLIPLVKDQDINRLQQWSYSNNDCYAVH